MRFHEAGFDGPGGAAFFGGVGDVEVAAEVLRVEVFDGGPDVPNGCAEIIGAGVVLDAAADADGFVEGGEVAQGRGVFADLIRNSSEVCISPKAAAIMFDAEFGGGAEERFGLGMSGAGNVDGD